MAPVGRQALDPRIDLTGRYEDRHRPGAVGVDDAGSQPVAQDAYAPSGENTPKQHPLADVNGVSVPVVTLSRPDAPLLP